MPDFVLVAAALAVLSAGSLVGVLVQTARLRRTRGELARIKSSGSVRRSQPRVVRHAGKAVRAVAGTAALVRDKGVSGVLASSFEEFAAWVRDDSSGIAKSTAADGTVTILFSDIEGSTELNEQLGDRAWVKVLDAHNAVVTGAFARHHGHVVKSQGDGFMVVFADPAEAVRAANEIHRQLAAGARRRRAVAVRIGMHRGAVVAKDGDIFGRNVAMAARVAAEARGGETLVSDEVHEMLIDDPALVFTQAFDAPLKGLAGSHTLWQVDAFA